MKEEKKTIGATGAASAPKPKEKIPGSEQQLPNEYLGDSLNERIKFVIKKLEFLDPDWDFGDRPGNPKVWRSYVSAFEEFLILENLIRTELYWAIKWHQRTKNIGGLCQDQDVFDPEGAAQD